MNTDDHCLRGMTMNADERGFYIGRDLGQRCDYTAVAVVERDPGPRQFGWPQTPRVTRYNLRHLERMKLGTPYPEVVSWVRDLVQSPEMSGICVLAVDATGVGAPVVDMLRAARLGCKLSAVTITGGDRETEENSMWRVPKRDLVIGLQVALDDGSLRIAERLAEAAILVKELMNMRVKISVGGHDSYGAGGGWREGSH